MIITICSSMVFAEQAVKVKAELEKKGHQVFVSGFIEDFIGKTVDEKEKKAVVYKTEKDAIKAHWKKIQKSDAILVLNYEKRGIKNYLGGNTLMEMGFAFVLDKKIFLMNPVPDIPYYKSEVEAVKPIIINGNLSKIR